MTEQGRELVVGRVVEMVLATEEHHLVAQQCVADLGHDLRGEVAAEADPVDPRTDVLTELGDLDVCARRAGGQRRCGVDERGHDRVLFRFRGDFRDFQCLSSQ
jgi:hypothetical protein